MQDNGRPNLVTYGHNGKNDDVGEEVNMGVDSARVGLLVEGFERTTRIISMQFNSLGLEKSGDQISSVDRTSTGTIKSCSHISIVSPIENEEKIAALQNLQNKGESGYATDSVVDESVASDDEVCENRLFCSEMDVNKQADGFSENKEWLEGEALPLGRHWAFQWLKKRELNLCSKIYISILGIMVS